MYGSLFLNVAHRRFSDALLLPPEWYAVYLGPFCEMQFSSVAVQHMATFKSFTDASILHGVPHGEFQEPRDKRLKALRRHQ